MFHFERLSPGLNVALFAAAAVLVWAAGTRLANYADAIAARTHLSKVFLGIILGGGDLAAGGRDDDHRRLDR